MQAELDMRWLENLPENCPPEDAYVPSEFVCYRIVSNNPVDDSDFYSHRELYPSKRFPVSECKARAASVMKNVDDANVLIKLPHFKTEYRIVRVCLNPGAGVVKHTPSMRSRLSFQSHHSWWVASDYVTAITTEEL